MPTSAGFVTSNLLQTDTLMCLPLLVIILFALLPFVIYVILLFMKVEMLTPPINAH